MFHNYILSVIKIYLGLMREVLNTTYLAYTINKYTFFIYFINHQ